MLPQLTRREIARILKRHRGSQVEVAHRAGVARATVAVWLKHGTSAKVEKFATEVARELLAREEADRLSKGEANGPSARQLADKIRQGDESVKPLVEKLKIVQGGS
jgi:predicted transcriptional regulator